MYLSKPVGQRLRDLKAKYPESWRTFVKYHVNPEGLDQGLQDGKPIWYSFREEFPETPAHKALPRMRHTGWYGDTEHQEKLVVGTIFKIPHGRWLAGLISEDNDERVIWSDIFDNPEDAARMADEHARIYAEKEDDYSRKWNEARRLDDLIEDKLKDVEKSFALRNHPKLGPKERRLARHLIDYVRELRAEREALDVEA